MIEFDKFACFVFFGTKTIGFNVATIFPGCLFLVFHAGAGLWNKFKLLFVRFLLAVGLPLLFGFAKTLSRHYLVDPLESYVFSFSFFFDFCLIRFEL